jgi:hypothetical protein
MWVKSSASGSCQRPWLAQAMAVREGCTLKWQPEPPPVETRLVSSSCLQQRSDRSRGGSRGVGLV